MLYYLQYVVFVKWRYILNMILLTPKCPKSASVKCLFILQWSMKSQTPSLKHYGLVKHFQSSDQDHVFLHWIYGDAFIWFFFFFTLISVYFETFQLWPGCNQPTPDGSNYEAALGLIIVELPGPGLAVFGCASEVVPMLSHVQIRTN